MKKIVRLTESDLTRIVKRVIQEEQLNEGLNLKSILPAVAIAASLNLSSCKTKSDYEQKLPEIEALVKTQVESADKFYKDNPKSDDGYSDEISFKKITSLKGPFKKCPKCPNQYFIVVNVDEVVEGQKLNNYFIDIYEEGKDGKGKIIGVSSSFGDMKEVNRQIDYFKNYERWDQYSNYGDYMDRVNSISGWLDYMKDEYRGETYGSVHNSPSEYFRDIDRDTETLKGMKIDVKDDLENGNVTQKEFDIITNSITELLPQLEEFKYTIK